MHRRCLALLLAVLLVLPLFGCRDSGTGGGSSATKAGAAQSLAAESAENAVSGGESAGSTSISNSRAGVSMSNGNGASSIHSASSSRGNPPDSGVALVTKRGGDVVTDGSAVKNFFLSGEAAGNQAQYTGKTQTADLNNNKQGGGQYIGKLFSEGLSRAPTPAEYKEYAAVIQSKGCVQPTLRELAAKMFGSAGFTGMKLSADQATMCVYRAVLNRDPKNAEYAGAAQKYKAGQTPAQLAAALADTAEFKALIPAIDDGPYSWGANNDKYSLSGKIMRASELRQRLRGSETVIELDPGTLVLMDYPLTLPAGKTLRTKGKPVHYAQQARFLRVTFESTLITAQKGSTVENIWIDGNRSAFLDTMTRNNGGQNIVFAQDNCKLVGSRVSDTASGATTFAQDTTDGHLISGNLITCYATDHRKAYMWADGINIASSNTVIENNHVIDATDVGIIVFRRVSTNFTVAQNSAVRNNRVINLGNSAFGGLHTDAWHSHNKEMNFRGNVFQNNELWTSMRAHMHIVLSMASMAWMALNNGNLAFGASMVNNYTPSGLYALCAAGIAVDGMKEANMHGNQLRVYTGRWTNEHLDAKLRERVYSVNSANSSGSLQQGYIDLPTFTSQYSFIVALHANETAKTLSLKEALIWEKRR